MFIIRLSFVSSSMEMFYYTVDAGRVCVQVRPARPTSSATGGKESSREGPRHDPAPLCIGSGCGLPERAIGNMTAFREVLSRRV